MSPGATRARVASAHVRFWPDSSRWHLRWLVVLVVLAGGWPGVSGAATADGWSMFLQGERGGGAPLLGRRESGGTVQGLDAACASCHRRSGLGTFEGAVRVPPIAWRLLSRSWQEIAADRSVPHVLGFHPQRPAYTRDSFARAVREGIGADGRALSWVMPRYADLSAAEIDALVAVLETRAAGPPAGASDGQLRFALLATPGSETQAVDAAAAILTGSFAAHNAQIGTAGASAAPASSAYDVPRRLELVVWQLEGPSESWPAQLERRQQREPVFALLAGVGPGDWTPIDHYCERQQLPLLLPSIQAPAADAGFYTVHFHRGVALEADVIAGDLRAAQEQPAVLLQYLRADDGAALAAARRLRTALEPAWQVKDVLLPAQAGAPPILPAGGAAVVSWLPAADLTRLGDLPGAGRIYISAVMAGEQPPLAQAWWSRTRIAYPWEVPERRRVAMNFPFGWLRAKGLPVVDERLQVDTWLAAEVLQAALADMIDAYYPDYLVERVESLVGHRLVNAHYPRLSLAAGQRFASKGAYLLRVQGDGSLTAEGGWRIP
ncbi:MAG: cytochrome C [Pseudomonadota bacterium]|nr:cytochrome C [Pseudomonadota bacterium]